MQLQGAGAPHSFVECKRLQRGRCALGQNETVWRYFQIHPDPTSTERGRIAAPDYRELYFEMFRASEAAIRLLQQAQARAEEAYLAAQPPPLELPDDPPDDRRAGPPC